MPSMVYQRLPAVVRITALASVIAITVGACAGRATTAPSPAPGSPPTAAPGELVLERAPDNTACDTIGIDYTLVTLHIDPSASPQIWADADTGTTLTVRWDSSFEAGTGATVVDDSGAVVLEDGDTLEMPEGAYPELAGHFVCTGPPGLVILDQVPS